MELQISYIHICSLERSHAVLIEQAYPYLDKNKCLGLLDTNICKPKIMKIFLENITQIIE